MNVNRVLSMREEGAVKRFQRFISAWWKRVELAALLAPIELPGGTQVVAKVIDNPADLAALNPFAPIMLNNAAEEVNEFLLSYPDSPIALILRPCELRTLVELQKRHRLPLGGVSALGTAALYPAPLTPHEADSRRNVTIIGVDCPGTFSAMEYNQQVAAVGAEALTRAAFAYGGAQGISPKQLRSACQMCDWPAPRGADITIGTISVVPQYYMLVSARDEASDARYRLPEITDRLATELEIVGWETAIGAIADRNAARRAQFSSTESPEASDIFNLLVTLAQCSLCADCLDACPLYDGELSGMLGVSGGHTRARPVLAELASVSRWLASCSGCGMCQEACSSGVSLANMFSLLSHRIRAGLHYTAGEPFKQLPWKPA